MCLRQQADKVTVCNVAVLLTPTTAVHTAQGRGVIIDIRLTKSAHVSAVCRLVYGYLWQHQPVVRECLW